MPNEATDECGPKRGSDAGAEHKLPEHEHPELSTELGPSVEPTRAPMTADLSEEEVVITLSSVSSSSSAPTPQTSGSQTGAPSSLLSTSLSAAPSAASFEAVLPGGGATSEAGETRKGVSPATVAGICVAGALLLTLAAASAQQWRGKHRNESALTIGYATRTLGAATRASSMWVVLRRRDHGHEHSRALVAREPLERHGRGRTSGLCPSKHERTPPLT